MISERKQDNFWKKQEIFHQYVSSLIRREKYKEIRSLHGGYETIYTFDTDYQAEYNLIALVYHNSFSNSKWRSLKIGFEVKGTNETLVRTIKSSKEYKDFDKLCKKLNGDILTHETVKALGG